MSDGPAIKKFKKPRSVRKRKDSDEVDSDSDDATIATSYVDTIFIVSNLLCTSDTHIILIVISYRFSMSMTMCLS